MPNIIRMPITNTLMGSDYTGRILVGARNAAVDVILDTGSASLAVDCRKFNPLSDAASKTTKLAQAVQYGSGSWVGAIVQTQVGLSSAVRLKGVNMAVTYTEAGGIFGAAGGIWGLAYPPLNNAYLMSGNTWQARYDADQLTHGHPAAVDPYFSQLEQAGLVANCFAFYTRRSIVRVASASPAADPENHGIFVIGGGPDCTDLYKGGFHDAAVLDDFYYNTNLLAVQIGGTAPIAVPPLPAGSTGKSNSIVDSGTSALVFAQSVFNQILAAFGSINPNYAALLQAGSPLTGKALDQRQLDLGAWPHITLTLQGANGAPVRLRVTAWNYWQTDAGQNGAAIANIFGDNGSFGGQTILGLPLLTQYFTVFDRTADRGHGRIRFAERA